MSLRSKICVIKLSLILASMPAVLHGYETGPPFGFTAAPGDNPTACVNAGCHQGTPNSGPGNVKILLPAGNSGTYTPGQMMQLLVQITDSTKKAYGFEMTARLASNPTTAQAGQFITADANTQLICADGSDPASGPCP